MNFTDLFIKRPVLAIVISLLFVVLGLEVGYQPAGQPISADAIRG